MHERDASKTIIINLLLMLRFSVALRLSCCSFDVKICLRLLNVCRLGAARSGRVLNDLIGKPHRISSVIRSLRKQAISTDLITSINTPYMVAEPGQGNRNDSICIQPVRQSVAGNKLFK